MKLIKYIFTILGFLLSILIINNLYMHYKEEKLITKYISDMNIKRSDFNTTTEYFSSISEYLNNDFNTDAKTWKHSNLLGRTFLRNSVMELLEIKEGVCGEGTRVMIRILQSLGYNASRIAFYDKRFGAAHALVSVIIKDTEIIVDTINYNKELHEILKNNKINMKQIDIIHYNDRFVELNKTNPSEFSNFFKKHYATYSYESIPYVKFASKLGADKHIFNFDRPNKYISYLAESVYLIKAIFFFILLIILTFIYYYLKRGLTKNNI